MPKKCSGRLINTAGPEDLAYYLQANQAFNKTNFCFLWCQLLRLVVLHLGLAQIFCKSQTLKGDLGYHKPNLRDSKVESIEFQYHKFSDTKHGLNIIDWQGSIKPMKRCWYKALNTSNGSGTVTPILSKEIYIMVHQIWSWKQCNFP